jgi:hypothetical protein
LRPVRRAFEVFKLKASFGGFGANELLNREFCDVQQNFIGERREKLKEKDAMMKGEGTRRRRGKS